MKAKATQKKITTKVTPRISQTSASSADVSTEKQEFRSDRFDSPIIVCDTRDRSVVVVGDNGEATAGYRGCAIGGFHSKATALCEGLAYVFNGDARCIGHGGIAITCAGGTAHAVDRLAVTYRGGHALMDGCGIAIAINEKVSLDATAQASPGGLIILGYRVTVDGPINYVVRFVDGVLIEGNKPYSLDNDYQPVLATAAI